MIIPRFRVEIGLKELFNIRKGLRYFNSLKKDQILFFNSCSDAIVFYLTQLRKLHNRKLIVGVPLYACWSIFHSVFSSVNEIRFLDVSLSDDSHNLNLRKYESLDVLIVIHYFGIRSNYINQIKEYFPQLIIIEDCSHVSLKSAFNTRYSNVAVYSFNFHKPITAAGGGALVFNNEGDREIIQEAYCSLPMVSKQQYFKIIIKLLLINFGFHPFVYSIIFKKLRSKKTNSKNNKPGISIPRKINNISKYILGNQYSKIMTNYNNQYLKIPSQFRMNINRDEIESMSYFPLFFDNSLLRNNIMAKLIQMGIDCFVLWENAIHRSISYGNNKSGRFRETENILNTILFLPESVLCDLSPVIEILKNINVSDMSKQN